MAAGSLGLVQVQAGAHCRIFQRRMHWLALRACIWAATSPQLQSAFLGRPLPRLGPGSWAGCGAPAGN